MVQYTKRGEYFLLDSDLFDLDIQFSWYCYCNFETLNRLKSIYNIGEWVIKRL